MKTTADLRCYKSHGDHVEAARSVGALTVLALRPWACRLARWGSMASMPTSARRCSSASPERPLSAPGCCTSRLVCQAPQNLVAAWHFASQKTCLMITFHVLCSWSRCHWLRHEIRCHIIFAWKTGTSFGHRAHDPEFLRRPDWHRQLRLTTEDMRRLEGMFKDQVYDGAMQAAEQAIAAANTRGAKGWGRERILSQTCGRPDFSVWAALWSSARGSTLSYTRICSHFYLFPQMTLSLSPKTVV